MPTIEAPVADWVTIPELYKDPFPAYERLRAEGGVHWVPAINRFLITSYAAVHDTELDQELFSANEEGSLQIRAMGHSMLRRDDPDHYVERKAWQPVLRPGVVRRQWTQVFRKNAERYFNELIEKGSGADLVWDFAAPYAAENLREIIGLHNARQEDLQRWSQTMIDATGNYSDDPVVWAKGKAAFDEVDDALDEMLRWHAKNPDHSLISQLLRIPDYEMPIERLRANIKMTIGGGLNEPRDALGVATWAVLANPKQRAAATADPALWHSVFDETLRWVAPIGMYSRQVTRDTELQGVRLPAGAKLGICLLSANRDESVWRDADRFDIQREVRPHLAFGKGVHVCLGAWVARAEIADVALPMLFERLDGLRESANDSAEINGWVFRGMAKLPVEWDRVARGRDSAAVASAGEEHPLRVAVVGAGPAGCFTAQAVKRSFPAAQIDVFDQLPTPFGLIRYGVAADHAGTKSISHQFDRLFEQDGVSFRGNVRLGVDVTLDDLRGGYDATVLATGMHTDAMLSLPGAAEHSDRVHGAGAITRMLNAHPDAGDAPSLGERVVVVGNGNVAIDVIRMLTCDQARLEGSDVDDEQHRRLASDVRTIHVVGRSEVTDAKFDPVMVRELAGMLGVRHIVHGIDSLPRNGKDARADAVVSLEAHSEGAARVTVEWHFGVAPVAVESRDGALAMTLDDGDNRWDIEADDVITAIGFTADADSPLAPGSTPSGRVEHGLYTAGWLRRGPRGTIPDQRADARDLVRVIAEDLDAGNLSMGGLGLERRADEVDFTGWRRIDSRERESAAPTRSRAKLRTRALQLAAAEDLSIAVEPVGAVHESSIAVIDGPVTIVYGTESGSTELVAEELSRILTEGGTDVLVRDLGELGVEDLDDSRLHLVVCSTYGDGEVPTSLQGLLNRLAEEQPDLSKLKYAVFGMGDRSYTKTYSRGSELVDEALALRGAERFGEYGRHDAGGAVLAADAAVEWLSSVLAAAPAVAPAVV